MRPLNSVRFLYFFIFFSSLLSAQYNFENLELRMRQFIADKELTAFQTMIIQQGEVIHYDSHGFADVAEGKPLQDNSIFRIASITKCIVAVGIMKLYDQGYFKLEDPIGQYIPEYKNPMVYQPDGSLRPASKPIRIIDVLRHTTGIGKFYPLLREQYNELKTNPSYDLKTEIMRMSKIPLAADPGTQWIYSPSVSLGAYLVEKLTGTKIEDYLKAEIFDPLQMEDTFFEIPKEKHDRFTTGYLRNKKGGYTLIDHPSNSLYTQKVTFCNPAGGLASTIKDFSKFCLMLLNNGTYKGQKILEKQTVQLMTQDQLKGIKNGRPGDDIHKPNDAIGFGFTFNVIKNIDAYPYPGSQGSYGWHGSWGPYFKIDPKENLVMILMTQMKGWDHSRKEIFEKQVYNAIFEN
ncbi:MAG: serine hydrolase [Flavobacteriaceae bacterium]|nr:serine hydrolase [Flavobacteriaceae bacterium]